MLRSLSLMSVLGTTLALAACQKPADVDPAATTTAASPVSAPAPDATGTNGFLTITPGVMEACDPAAEAEITHDLHDQHPEVQTVELFIQSADGSEPKLFSRGSRSGVDKTGPWTRPGMRVILQNADTHEKLDEVVVAGPNCLK